MKTDARTSPHAVLNAVDYRFHEGAACVGADLALFFPPRGGTGVEARVICGGCPVRQQCLDWALPVHDLDGIWGGMSAAERAHERRRRAGGHELVTQVLALARSGKSQLEIGRTVGLPRRQVAGLLRAARHHGMPDGGTGEPSGVLA